MAEQIGRYEILEEIGRGGFATVYRARDTTLDRQVALKELRSSLLRDAEWVDRFQREGRTIARLDHPHIVPVYDVFEAEPRLFIVMRLVEGPSLEQRIGEGPLPWAEALEILKGVAWGLDYAHERGILHRDLKPGNILLDQERGAMLTDFGMAKLMGEGSGSITSAGGIVGTPHYIAPEIWEGKGTTRQSDVYALGCLLFEMVTGEKVFRGETPPAVMMAHFRPLDLPQQWPAGVPAGLSRVLQKALAKNPAERYATAGALAKAVAALTPGPVLPPDPGGEAERDRVEAFVPAEAEKSAEARRRSSRKRWRGFLNHLGPYLIVNGMLVGIYLLTDPGGYPWFVWPALGWGVGIAFHLMGVMLDEMRHLSGKWRGFLGHFGSYAIIIGMMIMIYMLTDPGGYPWFVWPALGWGAAVAIHLWSIFMGDGDPREVRDELRQAYEAGREEMNSSRHQTRQARRPAKRETRSAEVPDPAEARAARLAAEPPPVANPTIKIHLNKARTYQAQINALLKATSNQNIHLRLQDLSNQVQEWMAAVEALARRVDQYQQNNVIQHDLESVPEAIAKLERRLASENDPTTREELEQTLANRRNQLAALQHLRQTMRRAEIKIESTLSSLGTIYSQMLISQSTDHVADYSRLSAEVDEEVRTLQDHLEALEEVRLGSG